jgi:hypothetical protein
MATKERTTYISVPPPPLPEFYMKTRHEKKSSSTSATAEVDKETFVIKETVTSGDGTYDGKPGVVPSTSFVTVPPPRHTNEVPPLAIYHICRICLRPRSPRYHREHPIPIDGLPPPPGICRRCRVTSLEETKKVAEIVVKSESNPIKLGCITPFVPDEDIVSNEEMRRMKVEKYLKGRPSEHHESRYRSRSGKEIVYRHVKVVDAPDVRESEDEDALDEVIEEVWVPTKRKVVFTSQDAIQRFKDAATPDLPTAPKRTTTGMQVQPTTDPPSPSYINVQREALRAMDSAKASVSARASSTSGSGSTSTVRASAKVSTRSRPVHAELDIRKVARDEIEQYAIATQQPEQRHAEIRRIAREEVERYRQAERKLEAHPDAFAHGKLVPVERRIDVEHDIAEAMPWVQPTKKEVSGARDSTTTKSATAERDFAYESISESSKSKSTTGPTRKSWGPRWRRELSIERRSRHDASPYDPAAQKSDPRSNKHGSSQTKDQESNIQANARSQKFDDRVQEYNSPSWTTHAEPYAVEVSRKPTDDQNKVIRVIEEIDLPPRSRAAPYRREEYSNQSVVTPAPERIQKLRSEFKVGDGSRPVSSLFHRAERVKEDKRFEATMQADRDYWHDETATHTTAIRSSKQDASTRTSGVRSESQVQVSSPVIERSAHASTHSRVTFEEDRASDKTRWSRKHRMAEEGRAGRPTEQQDLPYLEDNVMPDHSAKPASAEKEKTPSRKPTQHISSSKHPNSEYLYIERTVQPADRPRGSRPFDGNPPEERIETEETYVVRRHPQVEGPSRPRRKYQGDRRTRESDESKHIKFNKKVEISPTPPGSDASSSEFRGFHSIGARNGRQMDGNEDTGRPSDITGEYERRGRTRSRDSKTKHFHEQEMLYERPDGEWIVKPKQKHKGGGSHRQAAWVSGSVPLEHPLSESPSREELISSSRYSKSDDRGPYREPEKVTDSMNAEDGSPGGRVWGDTAGGSMHSSIGQAAQVFW